MVELNDKGPAFVLGLDDPEVHRKALQHVTQCFRREDISRVGAMAAEEAEAIIAAHVGATAPSETVPRFDAIKDLVVRVPTRICRRYYVLPIKPEEEDEFARRAMDLSAYLFADPRDDPGVRHRARDSSQYMLRFLDVAIAEAKAKPADPMIVLSRLVDLQKRDKSLTDEGMRALMIGMVTGFVPTDTMAAGHILDVLIGKKRFLRWRRSRFNGPIESAIDSNDDTQLTRCLFETLRFLPINPGPFRICSADYEVKGGGWFGRGSRIIPAGSRLIASTQSAMFDGRAVRRPYDFNPARSRAEYMLLGSGLHACVGVHLAEAQITQTLKVLFKQKRLRRVKGLAGKLHRYGPFPARLMVQFR